MTSPVAAEPVRFGTPQGRWVLTAMVMGSGIAMLDATVVNVALRPIGAELGADLAGLQWILNGYLLTLASLILLGGSLGDRYGRRRVFVVGVVWFALASLLCGIAPNVPTLIAARALQGVGGALLTPGSLAILQASFHPDDRARAIGAWSGLGGLATAIGPFLGGYLVDQVDWRWIFLINLPVAVLVVLSAVRHVPESSDPTLAPGLDVAGALCGALGLGGVTYALIEGPARGATSPEILITAIGGAAALVGFVVTERRSPHPMLPLDVFASRQFTSANLVTFAVYAALGAVFFLLVVNLQTVLGYSALQAGTASLPVTVIMLLFSSRAGQLAARIGPRVPMTAGPLVAAAGLVLMTRIVEGATYVGAVLPAIAVFGAGLALTVAPLTATVLAAAPAEHAGSASGVNNAVARVAGLLAVAVLPAVAGLSGDDYADPAAFSSGFRVAILVSAALCAAGGAIAWTTIRNDVLQRDDGGDPIPPHPHTEDVCCGAGAPPLRPAGSASRP